MQSMPNNPAFKTAHLHYKLTGPACYHATNRMLFLPVIDQRITNGDQKSTRVTSRIVNNITSIDRTI
eukprot:scaffold749_cov242-Chaetoceros_neogracile.AAC.10